MDEIWHMHRGNNAYVRNCWLVVLMIRHLRDLSVDGEDNIKIEFKYVVKI
jgi:hypothetical protein